MNDSDYRDGLMDGLRDALAVLAAEEAKWDEKMQRRSSGPTFRAQATRKQAYKTAQARVQTVLNKLEREGASRVKAAPIERTLNKLGL